MAAQAEQSPEDLRVLQYVKGCWEKASSRMNARNQDCRKRERSYRGLLEQITETSRDWRSRLAPPYVLEIIETAYSQAFAEFPVSRLVPLSLEGEKHVDAHDTLMREQRRDDGWNGKFDQWAKQSFVMGFSPAKMDWFEDTRSLRRRIADAENPGVYKVGEFVAKDAGLSRPTFLPHPAMDAAWDPSASRMSECGFFIARYWVTLESLKADEIRENNPGGIYRNLDLLGETKQQSVQGPSARSMTDTEKKDRKGKIELWEMWTPTHIYAIANGTVTIRAETLPYFHQRIAWMMASPVPDLYTMEGISDVDMVMDIQAALWLLLNQRLDNVRLISNAIIQVRDTHDDPDSLEFKPGARWLVRSMDDVELWTPKGDIIGPSLAAEAMLKQDLMTLTANMPYLGGDATSVDPNTATQYSGSQSAAMNRIIAKRQRVFDPMWDLGELHRELNQQLWNGNRTVRQGAINARGEQVEYVEITVDDVIAPCRYEQETAAESLTKSEIRSERLLLMNSLAGLIPALNAQGQHLDMGPTVRLVGDSFGMHRADKLITDLPPPAPPGQAVPPGDGSNAGSNANDPNAALFVLQNGQHVDAPAGAAA